LPTQGPGTGGTERGAPGADGDQRPQEEVPGEAQRRHPQRGHHFGEEGEAREEAGAFSGAETRALAHPPKGQLAQPSQEVPRETLGSETVPRAQEGELARAEGQVHRPPAGAVPRAQARAVPGEEEQGGASEPPRKGGAQCETGCRPKLQTCPRAEKATLQRM